MNILSFFLVLRGQKCNGILSFHSDTFFRLDNRFVMKEIGKEVDQSRGCDDISLLLLGKLSKDCSEKKLTIFTPMFYMIKCLKFFKIFLGILLLHIYVENYLYL